MKMKRMLAVIMSVAMIFTIIPLGSFVFAAVNTGKCGNNLTWEYSDGALTITGKGSMYDWDYEKGTGYKKEPGWCKNYAQSIKKVVIGNGVTSVGNEAFWDCSSIQAVSIASSVTKIGRRAFSNCSKLKSITIPASVEKIGNLVFYGCLSLQKIAVNGNNKNYCSVSNVLLDKAKKTIIQYPIGSTKASYEVPATVTNIGAYSFTFGKYLKTVVLPQNVGVIGEAAFGNCTGLKNIIILKKNIKIGLSAFEKCNSLTKVYYAGTKTDWGKIGIGQNNGSLKNATVSYNYRFNLTNRTTALTALTNTLVGPKLEWKEVTGANGYYVYRRTSGKPWTRIAATKSTSYIDKTAKTGVTYIYTAKAYNSSYASKFQDGLVIKYINAPQVSGIINSVDGPFIRWNKISGASGYQVYRKTGSKGVWEKIATVKETSYRDNTAKSSKTYYYSVKSVSGKSTSSMRSGTAFTYLATPQISSIQNAVEAVYVKWSKVTGATAYQVYRKTANTGWAKVATVKETNYRDTKASESSTTYYYSVKAVSGDRVSSMRAGLAIRYLDAPTIDSIVKTADGNKITWGVVKGATQYQVYRKTANTGWAKIATAKAPSYTDAGAKSATKYYYSIKAVNGNSTSSMRSGIAFSYIDVPQISGAQNAVDAVYIKWNKVAGATEYQLRRKTENSDWEVIATLKGTNYRDTKVENGVTYYYSINAAGGNITSSDSQNVVIRYLAAPQVSDVQNAIDAVYIKWNEVAGATGYQVQRRTEKGSWEVLSTVAETSYKDTEAENGVKYYYSVKALNGDETSSMRAGTEFTYLAAPQISSVQNAVDAVYIKWNKVEGATGYQLLRKTENSDWEVLTTVTGTNYKDIKAENGVTYYYSVKALNGDETSSMRAGTEFTYLAAPQISKADNAVDAVYLAWNKVETATGYQVQRRTEKGSWEVLATVAETIYNDTKVESGVTYYYSIKAVNGKETSSMRPGTAVMYLAAPQVADVQNAVDSVYIKWNEVAGATGYQILKKTENGNWEAVAATTETSCKDTKVQNSKTYYYTVKAVNGDTTSAMYAGTEVTYLAAPQVSNIQNAVDSVYVSWTTVTGATGYQLHRRVENGNWEAIATVSGISYKDTKAESGTTYYYSVKALNGDKASAMRAGTAFTYLAVPKISSAQNAAGGPEIIWNKVTGATGYQVQRKTGNGNWEVIANVTETTYKDTDAKAGTTYYYTIKAVNGDIQSAVRTAIMLKCVEIQPVIPVASVELNATTLNWTIGKSGAFKATVLPANATNKTLEWSTSDSSVATITSDGKLIAVGVGTATITCRAADGSNKAAKCVVTVSAKPAPVSEAEILDYYKSAVLKVNESRAGFMKTRVTEESDSIAPVVFSTAQGIINDYMGIGPDNLYTATTNKGTLGGEIKDDADGNLRTYYYLSPVELSEKDIKTASCEKVGDAYVITLELNDGQSFAGAGLATVNNSALDRCGLCVGDRDINIFDHKTAEIMYSAVQGTYANAQIDEKTKKCKVVAKVNAASGEMLSLKVTYELECNVKIDTLENNLVTTAAGTTTVIYDDFIW